MAVGQLDQPEGKESTHVRICSTRFSDFTLERNKAWSKKQQDGSQLWAGGERIEQMLLVLRDLVVRDQQERLSDDK